MPNATDKYLFGLIKTWLGLLITNLNATLTTKSITNITKVTATMDGELVSSMDSDYKYFIRLKELKSEDSEAENFMNINCHLDFEFAMNNDDVAIYEKIIDNILYPLYYLLHRNNGVSNLPYSNALISAALKINSITERDITDMDLVADGYFKPKISFNLNVTDFV